MSAYTQYDPQAEKRRLLLQSEVLEEISDRALARLGPLEGARALDVACGAMGLLRALSRRVGVAGKVVGTDINEVMVTQAREVCAENGLGNVEVLRDDVFKSQLPERSFDVVHARLVLAPLGRDADIAAQLERLVKPGGWIILEEPNGFDSWRVWPDNGAHARLLAMIGRAFESMGGIEAGSRLMPLARSRGWSDIHFDAHLIAMPPGHPYLAIPVMMATALRSALLKHTPEAELDSAIEDARAACENADLHGITFTMIQVWGRAA